MQQTPALLQHSRRPEWGLAVIAWERDGKRGYLFESGMLRVLAEEFYKFMTPVEQFGEANRATFERLMAQVDTQDSGLMSSRSIAPALRFAMSDQIALFKDQYPDGFGEAWQKKVRGAGAKRRLKRHRDSAITHAQSELSREFLEQCAADNPQAAWEKVSDVLLATDLVPQAQVTALKSAAASRATQQGVLALLGALHGEEDFSMRFDAYVGALAEMLRKDPNWELATAPLALINPAENVCVRRTSYQTQADWLLPEFKEGKRVSALTYGGFLHLNKMVTDQLQAADLAPADNLDVHDFIKATTSPSAQSKMLATKQATEAAVKTDKDPAAAA